MNIVKSVNAYSWTAFEVERRLVQKLEELLQSVSWLRTTNIEAVEELAPGWDGIFRLQAAAQQAHLVIECKSHARAEQLPALATKWRTAPPQLENAIPVLAAPTISVRVAELCREHGWSWFDLAGNCHLEVPGLMLIDRSGCPTAIKPPSSPLNLSSAEAARVVRVLLDPNHAGHAWTQRRLHSTVQPSVSLGLVNKIVQGLREEAFLEDAVGRGFQVRDPEALLRAWDRDYRFERHYRRGYFTFHQGRRLVEALAKLEVEAPALVAYAGFSAADLQAPHVRQPRTWLYVAEEAEDHLRRVLEAKPVDSGENLVVTIPEDPGVFYSLDIAQGRLAATHPVQTYVDLTHCGGRGPEAAEALLEQVLRSAWKGQMSR